MIIRVYYNIFTVGEDDFATLTRVCNENELPEILRWIQKSPFLEFLTIEILPKI